MLQGIYLEQDLKDLYEVNAGEYNLTSLAGENITFGYDAARDLIQYQGGDLFFTDIKGVDGYVHFATKVPLPLSMTHTVYDVANEMENYTTQISFINAVFLRQDMRRLLPLTALYTPNEEWEGKLIEVDDIAEVVLENHLFEDLMWCDKLRGLQNQVVESLNGQTWFVTVNEDNFPCFDTITTFGAATTRACITRCDILARNGIVHEIDKIMLKERPETIGPAPPIAPTPRVPSAPTWNNPSSSGGDGSNPAPVQYAGGFGSGSPGSSPTDGAESSSATVKPGVALAFLVALMAARLR
jgi:hypothetical protein